jgi:hypothetical protein
MPSARFLKYLWFAYFSKPRHDRQIYRAIRRSRARTIVEMGIGDGLRAVRMIRLAGAYCDKPIRYTAIDLFEAREDDDSGLTLKEAYRGLKATGARVQVVPGDPLAALSRVANSLPGTDLLLISADQDQESLSAAWFYVPRMLHTESRVFVEEAGESEAIWREMSRPEINALAKRQEPRFLRAA